MLWQASAVLLCIWNGLLNAISWLHNLLSFTSIWTHLGSCRGLWVFFFFVHYPLVHVKIICWTGWLLDACFETNIEIQCNYHLRRPFRNVGSKRMVRREQQSKIMLPVHWFCSASQAKGRWKKITPTSTKKLSFFCGCWCNFFFTAPLAGQSWPRARESSDR